MPEDLLRGLLKEMKELAEDPKRRPEIHNQHKVDKVIEAATAVKNLDLQIETLKTFEAVVQNDAELQMVLNTSILYYVVVLLKEAEEDRVKTQCLDLLAWLAQSEVCINQLLAIHSVQTIVIKIADQQLKNMKMDDVQCALACKLAAFVFITTNISKKAQHVFQKLGIASYFCDWIKFAAKKLTSHSDSVLQICVSALERLASEPSQTDFILSQRIEAVIFDLIAAHVQKEPLVSSETCGLAANLFASIVIVKPIHAQHFIEMGAFKLLLEVVDSAAQPELVRFAIGAFVEILYAGRGVKYANVVAHLRSIRDVSLDDTLRKMMGIINRIKEDSEAIIIWATLLRIVCSVPKKEDFVREILLVNKYLSVCMDLLADADTTLRAKCAVLDAMDAVMCVQNMPKECLMNEVPKLITVMLRLKREFQSPRHKASGEYVHYQNAAEKSRSVLEKLGHSEGRDNKKFMFYAMMIVGTGLLIGTGINWARGWK